MTPCSPGDVGIFCVDGDMLCKQYYRDPMGTVYLFSLNRSRSDADQVFTAGSGRSLTCFGRVMLHTPLSLYKRKETEMLPAHRQHLRKFFEKALQGLRPSTQKFKSFFTAPCA